MTGSSRGLGLGSSRSLASLPSTGPVFATAQVTSPESVKAAAEQVAKHLNGKGLEILINNAGVAPASNMILSDMTDLESVFRINVLGAHITTSVFLPLLRLGVTKKTINFSTTLASMTQAVKYKALPGPAYKVTKAALNMLTIQQALEYGDEGFTVLALCPGWVKTDMGGAGADLTVDESMSAVLEIVRGKGKEDNGK